MAAIDLDFVKVVKTARGQKTYLYFDTGQKKPDGKALYAPLPALTDPSFGNVYASLKAGRTRRKNVAGVLTIKGLFDIWQKSPEFKNLAESTQDLYVRYVGEVVDLLMPAAAYAIEARDIQLIRDQNADRPGAATMMVAGTSSMFEWGSAPKRGYAPNNPCKHVEGFDGGEYDPWPDEVLAAALMDPDEVIRLTVALHYYTGQRVGDVCKLQLPKPGQTEWQVTQEKTDWDGIIPIHPELFPLLEARRDRNRMVSSVLMDAAQKKRATPSTVLYLLQRWSQEKFGLHVVTHGLRKNAVNTMLEMGLSVAQVSSITGQSLKTVEHYAKKRNQAALARGTMKQWAAHTVNLQTSENI
jgi:integrase